MLEIFPKYGSTILSSNFGTVVETSFWKNIFLTTFVHICQQVLWDKHFCEVWNLEKSDTIVKLSHWSYVSVCTKSNLCLSATKLPKLVYTPLNVSFLKTLVLNLSFSLQILTSRKEKELSCSVSNKNLIFVSFVHVFNKSWNLLRFFKQNKNIIDVSFIIYWFKRFRTVL